WKRGTAVMGIVLAGIGGIVAATTYRAWNGKNLHLNSEEVVAHRIVAVDERGNRFAVLGDIGRGTISGLLLFPPKNPPKADLESAAQSLDKTLGESGASGLISAGEGGYMFLAGRRDKDHAQFALNLSGDPDEASLTLLGKTDRDGKSAGVFLNASGSHPYWPYQARISVDSK